MIASGAASLFGLGAQGRIENRSTGWTPMAASFCHSCRQQRTPDQTVCPACNAQRPLQGWPVDPHIGKVIDQKYRIERRLAAGGFGTVFLATHLHGEHELGKVVLKFLHSELAHDAA